MLQNLACMQKHTSIVMLYAASGGVAPVDRNCRAHATTENCRYTDNTLARHLLACASVPNASRHICRCLKPLITGTKLWRSTVPTH